MSARFSESVRRFARLCFICVAAAAGVSACIATAPQYSESVSLQETVQTNSPYKSLSLGLVMSENARKSVAYQTERRRQQEMAAGFRASQYSADQDPNYVTDQLTQLLKKRFKTVIEIPGIADAKTHNLDMTLVLDLRVKLGEMTGQTTSVYLAGIFADPAGGAIETLAGEGTSAVPYPAFIPRFKDAANAALRQFTTKLDTAADLTAFAGRAPSPSPVAEPKRTEPEPLGKIADRWAVVIGISDYKYADPKRLPNLKYAHRDAEVFAAFLKSEAGGGFRDDHVLLLTNEQATARNIREALFEFLKHTVKEDFVLIYSSGHGMPDPDKSSNLYLVAYDSDPRKIAATGFPMWDLDTALRRTIAAERVVAFVDTCHSSGTTEGIKGVKVGDEFNKYFENLANTKPGRVVFTSCEGYEVSREDAKWGGGHGVFTWALLEGLRGKADSDADGIVALGELLDYVDVTVRRETANEQHPARAGVQFDRKLPLGVVK